MRYLPLIAVMALSINLSGQCSYETNDIDPFTKAVRLFTKKEIIYRPSLGGTGVFLQVAKVDTGYYLYVYIDAQKPYCANADSKFLVLTTDDEVIEFPKTFGSDCSNLRDHIFRGRFSYSTTEQDLLKLSKKKISMVRFQSSDGYIDFNIEKGNANKRKGLGYFIYHAPCVLK